MPRAAIYARYSTDLQDPSSIEDQIGACTMYALAHGHIVQAVYSDYALSGSNLHRHGVKRLLSDSRKRSFDIVISEALDRISRDPEGMAHVYKAMQFSEIQIICLSEGVITENNVLLGSFAASQQIKSTSEKTRRGMKGRVEKGKSGGGISYGYRVAHTILPNGEVERGNRTIDPDQSAVVVRIFGEYASGKSPRSIAIALNREGVTGPRGKKWGPLF